MGSNCIVKGCRLGNTTSYHRLKKRIHKGGLNLERIFGRGNIKVVTDSSRICYRHKTIAEFWTERHNERPDSTPVEQESNFNPSPIANYYKSLPNLAIQSLPNLAVPSLLYGYADIYGRLWPNNANQFRAPSWHGLHKVPASSSSQSHEYVPPVGPGSHENDRPASEVPGPSHDLVKKAKLWADICHLRYTLYSNLIECGRSMMIAGPVLTSATDSAMASSSSGSGATKAAPPDDDAMKEEGDATNEDVHEEEEGRGTENAVGQVADQPTRGKEEKMDDDPPRPLPPVASFSTSVALPPRGLTLPTTNGEVGLGGAPPEEGGRGPGPRVYNNNKEEEEGHPSSEDEDKLVINESGLEKRESLRLEEDAVTASGSQSEVSESSPKSPSLKRASEDPDPALEASAKRPRTQDANEDSANPAPTPQSLRYVDESLALVTKDLKALKFLLHQKEEEWNGLLTLLKKKEELALRLLRQKELLKMGRTSSDPEEGQEEDSVVFLPQGTYASLGTSQFPLMMMRHYLGEGVYPRVVPPTKSTTTAVRETPNVNGPSSGSQGNISVIDIHTSSAKTSTGAAEAPQISISSETHTKLGKQLNSYMPMKPILPKPMNATGALVNARGSGTPPPPHPSSVYGPQGPMISVHQLIASHRKENTSVTPIRGAKRGAWRHRYEGEKRSSSREPDRPSSVSSSSSDTEVRVSGGAAMNAKSSSSNSLLTMNDPSVSYKDVLLQFAQLTQTEKQPGSPQISIIPVSTGESSQRKAEPYPDSTSISRELPASSQNSNNAQNMEGSSALAKLLMESGASNHGHVSKSPTMDLSMNHSPHNLTLSALLSGGTTTTITIKEKAAAAAAAMRDQAEARSKKSSSHEEGNSNSNPKCQGCHKHRAQFVCAGCGNQWYCSRNCQVTAWERHSEHCNS